MKKKTMKLKELSALLKETEKHTSNGDDDFVLFCFQYRDCVMVKSLESCQIWSRELNSQDF